MNLGGLSQARRARRRVLFHRPFALGQAFCFYYRAVHQGHVPKPEELRRYYQDQLARAEQTWKEMFKARDQQPEAGT